MIIKTRQFNIVCTYLLPYQEHLTTLAELMKDLPKNSKLRAKYAPQHDRLYKILWEHGGCFQWTLLPFVRDFQLIYIGKGWTIGIQRKDTRP